MRLKTKQLRADTDGTLHVDETGTYVGVSSSLSSYLVPPTFDTSSSPPFDGSMVVDGVSGQLNIGRSGTWSPPSAGTVRDIAVRRATSSTAPHSNTVMDWPDTVVTARGLTWNPTNKQFIVDTAGVWYCEATGEWWGNFYPGTYIRGFAIIGGGNALAYAEFSVRESTTESRSTYSLSGLVRIDAGYSIYVQTWMIAGDPNGITYNGYFTLMRISS